MYTALLCQIDQQQCKIWESALLSQGVNVIANPNPQVIDTFVEIQKPQVMILDLSIPYLRISDICHQYRSRFPNISFIFTQPLIDAMLQDWAVKEGAVDLVPYLSDSYEIISTFIRIFQRLQWSHFFSAKTLNATLSDLKTHLDVLKPSPVTGPGRQSATGPATVPAPHQPIMGSAIPPHSSPASTDSATNPANSDQVNSPTVGSYAYRGLSSDIAGHQANSAAQKTQTPKKKVVYYRGCRVES